MGCRVSGDVNALESAWFDAGARDSELSDELAAALVDRQAPDFRRLKVGLGLMLGALLVLALPLLRPSLRRVELPVPMAVNAAPCVTALGPIEAARKLTKQSLAKKPARRTPGKAVARK